jgi:hypothetical protein
VSYVGVFGGVSGPSSNVSFQSSVIFTRFLRLAVGPALMVIPHHLPLLESKSELRETKAK